MVLGTAVAMGRLDVRAIGAAVVRGAAVVASLVGLLAVVPAREADEVTGSAEALDDRGRYAGRDVGAALVVGRSARSARSALEPPADAIPMTTAAHPTTAAQDTVADTTLPKLM